MNHGDTEIRRIGWEESHEILGACIEVHRLLGPGLLENAYEVCLAEEFRQRGIAFRQQVALPIHYKGIHLDAGYRIDFLVGDVVLELKAVTELLPIHNAQVLTYLALTGKPVGLLVNFHVTSLRRGIRRLVR